MPNKYAAIARGASGRSQARPPEDEEGQSWLGGFASSVTSSIPELVGAPPTERAEAFRTEHPISGFISEMAGFSVPYLGAEAAVAKVPGLAARLGAGVERATGGLEAFGIKGAQTSPVWRGAARELIVNAPVEAGRLALGSVMYPENMDELGWDVALSAGVTGLAGAGFGALARGGKARPKKAVIDGVEDFTAPAFQLAAIEEGATVRNADPVEYANELERIALKDNPGKSGVKGAAKKLDYLHPLPGHPLEQEKNLNSLLTPGKEDITITGLEGPDEKIPTGLTRQYLIENESGVKPKSQYLLPGQQADIIAQLPEGIDSIRKLASTVQYPKLLTVVDKDGARQLAGKLSLPGMQKVGKTSYIQDREGLFFVAHELTPGKGNAVGKGAGKIRPGSTYLVGKMADPGLLEPEAKGLADMVTAPWARWKGAYQAGRKDNIFSKADDAYLSVVNKRSYEQMRSMSHEDKVSFLAEKLGKVKAETLGLLDNKFNMSDSRSLQDLAESIAISLKPTSHLQRQNRDYGHYFGLMKNGQKVGEEWTRKAFHGASKMKPGASAASAIFGTGRKGLETVSGYRGHAPVEKLWEPITEAENDLITRLANADVLSPSRVKKLVKEGALSPEAGQSVEAMRALNEDFINDIIPVLDDAGQPGVEWLKNHLGIPRTARGELFTEIRDKNNKLKHIAWGRTGAEVEREAKAVVDEAAAAGEKWKYDPAKLRDLPAESSQALAELQRNIASSIGKTTEDGEILTRAMRRLSSIKGTTGKNPAIPITSGLLKKRKDVPSTGVEAPYSKADTLNSMYGHMSQLSKFAAMQNWQSRFGREAKDMLKGHDPKMYEDLMLKGRQYLGIESQFTNALNRKLSNVLPTTWGSKPATAIAAAVNETIFSFTLGLFNMSHAILNLLSPIQTVMPWIMHMATLPPQAAADLMGHTVTTNAQGAARGLSAYVEPIKVMSSAIKLLGKPTPELKGFLERAVDDGVFHPQLFEEWVGQSARNRLSFGEAYKNGGMAEFLRKVATFAGEESEKMSRLIAFNAAYRVGKDIAGLSDDALYKFMKRANEHTMFGYHTVDRSNLTTGPIGSMFGLFKNWQMHFIGNMMQYADLAINKGNFGPLLWAGGAATTIGGLGATPLIAIADGIGNWENDANSSYLWMQDNWSPELSDAAYFGLPSFLGVSLQASSTLPGTDVRNEVTSLFSFAMWNRAKMLYKVYEKADEFQDATGMNPMQDPNVRDMLMQAVTPRAFIRAMSITEEDYVRSMSTGYPQVRDVSPVGKMLHGMGVNVVEIESMQEASQILYKHEEKRAATIRGLGRAYYDAISDGDTEEATRVIERSIGLSIPLDRVARSAMAIRKREETGDILSRYSLAGQAEARSALAQGQAEEEE